MPITTPFAARHAVVRRALIAALASAAACSNSTEPKSGNGSHSFKSAPCSVTGTLQLTAAAAARVDCSNGGTTLTLAGAGAKYLVLAQFPVDLVSDSLVHYRLSTGTPISASLAPSADRVARARGGSELSAALTVAPRAAPGAAQRRFTALLRDRARRNLAAHAWPIGAGASRTRVSGALHADVPAAGSLRDFRVPTPSATSFMTATARLAVVGVNVLIYVDTLAPANGFTTTQLQAFATLFDQTLYPIDTSAFGAPSDVDQNGRVILFMTPAVNALVTSSECQQTGYVAGFFNEEDLGGGAADPNSNQGEVFYSIVPDPAGTKSCAHDVDEVDFAVPGTFLHELQHLISFSQHVVVHHGNPEFGWLDEGLSIVAEELGSRYYEQKCPGTACRTNPSQLFPDSSQGFVINFLYDSYQYALLPDTASVTLHSDADNGFAWRGGDWLLVRWLGDQMGSGIFKKLVQSSQTGVANIASATGQPFPSLFADFGLALYTDSLPGFPRTTAPAADRFTSRNVRQLWNRLFVTSGGASDVPFPDPLFAFPLTADTSLAVLQAGTSAYYELDTPASAPTITLEFSGPAGAPLAAALKPQLVVFRLPGS